MAIVSRRPPSRALPAAPPPRPRRGTAGCLPRTLPLALAALAALAPGEAAAHVKWFCAFDVSDPPRPLSQVLTPLFWQMLVASLAALWLGALFERTPAGAYVLRATGATGVWLRPRVEGMLRLSYATFFVACALLGDMILTPELKTGAPFIPVMQAVIAACLLWRPTMVVAALGMAVLFGLGLWHYGLFHMMDYPLFLSVALWCALVGLDRRRVMTLAVPRLGRVSLRRIDVLRWGAGITLMWASIEKWAYPEWTYPLMVEHPGLTMGLDADFFMVAAGFVEFALAFALLWTPLVRRVSAVLLAAIFVSAIPEFGMIDAVGHLPIIAILVALAVDDPPPVARTTALAPAWCGAALAGYVAFYYASHAALFPGALAVASN